VTAPAPFPDLLLVNPGSAGAYRALPGSLPAVEPPVWAGLLATFARLRGHAVEILDANAERLDPAAAAERAAARSPRLVAVAVYGHNPSASTPLMPAVGLFCRALKERAPEIPILLLGGHVAALPERTLAEEAADFTCGGEGPYTLAALLDLLRKGEGLAPEALASVPDLRFRDGEAVRATAAAPLVSDLDREMPAPAWDLLPMGRYRAHNWHCFGEPSRTPYAAIYTSLGCPYRCTFCCIQAPFRSAGEGREGRRSYRLWSPEAVLAQLDTLVRDHGVRHVKVADELFVLDRRHVRAICEGILARGYDLNLWAYARVDTLREEDLPLLRKAGFRWLAVGIESASDRVRDDAGKGYPPGRLRSALAAVRAAGISVIGNYLFGLPEDDAASMGETLALAEELNCEFANFNCAMAYPGSDLYGTALRERWPLPETWDGYSQYSRGTLPLATRHLSGREVLAFRDDAFVRYFDREAYRAMLRERFGEGAVEEVRAMLAKRIERG
jgi:radical SAM superfamily enzyme YgiQ (UPF0313 family)